MKKNIIALLIVFICLSLTSCGNKKEYTAAEVSVVIKGITRSVLNEIDSMTDTELYGSSSNEDDRQKHFKTIDAELHKKYAPDYEIRDGNITIAGVFISCQYIPAQETSVLTMEDVADEDGSTHIVAYTDDISFDGLVDGDEITITADYKQGELFNAKLVK